MGKMNEVYQSMITFYAGDPKHIQHFVKVHSFAKLIGELEGLDKRTQEILEVTAYVHDIGIKIAKSNMDIAPRNCRKRKVLWQRSCC